MKKNFGVISEVYQAGQCPNPADLTVIVNRTHASVGSASVQTSGSDKPDPASVTNVVDLQILDCSRPVRPLALPAEAVLKVIPLVSESVGSIESSWLK